MFVSQESSRQYQQGTLPQQRMKLTLRSTVSPYNLTKTNSRRTRVRIINNSNVRRVSTYLIQFVHNLKAPTSSGVAKGKFTYTCTVYSERVG